ncbi:Major facilitator superfamily MFS_1 [uncultured Pleomorphomonas sp.]|uniref:Bcr/CflA family efflux transporter n=1 Tax=uncultured Pleomorphomonas sp. TaxID=442121 RepID=A0A212L2D1_9HYPH|nr:multidrug effflux MFS transporter [uncultured Pleomorphomonas sp.]SCM71712.1 Major facilitator superfamily MFS_1 [uncultured Pleomorphomonas sp.]
MITTTGQPVRQGPGFAETVALVAALMGLTALAIDTMLPALPAIGASYGLAEANELQLVVYAYMIGFGVAQVVYGPLSDVYGRRPLVIAGLVILIAGAIVSALASDFDHLLVARVLQGVGAAAARVIAVSIVRDRYAGREMARVMSFTMMVFMIVPVLAPTFGGLLLALAGWRSIFATMAALSIVVGLWFYVRMPETLHPEFRRALSVRSILDAARICVTNREAVGYSLAIGLLFAMLMGFIGSAEQILGSDGYHLGTLFPLAFASVAITGGIAAFVNSRLVRTWGMHRLSHGSHLVHVGLTAAFFVAAHLFGGLPPLWLFIALMIAMQFFFSIAISNYNALALDPLGEVAGTASSLIGAFTTIVGTIGGALIGQAFDGTVAPLSAGFFALSAVTLLIVYWTERGRLFQPHHQGIVPAGAE